MEDVPATKGLQEKFGQKRVFDTPLSEDSLMGVAVGSAISGARPIYLQSSGFFVVSYGSNCKSALRSGVICLEEKEKFL